MKHFLVNLIQLIIETKEKDIFNHSNLQSVFQKKNDLSSIPSNSNFSDKVLTFENSKFDQKLINCKP
jgi:hypothetical protein